MGTYEHAREETKKKIVNAFWQIYQEKTIDKITVREITELSGIHRATFYLYYSDIYAVLERIEKRILREVTEICAPFAQRQFSSIEFVRQIYDYYQTRRPYFHHLIIKQRDSVFAAEIQKMILDSICQYVRLDLEQLPPKDRLLFQTTGSELTHLMLLCSDEESFTFEDTLNILLGFSRTGLSKTLQNVYGIPVQLPI